MDGWVSAVNRKEAWEQRNKREEVQSDMRKGWTFNPRIHVMLFDIDESRPEIWGWHYHHRRGIH